MRGITSFFAGFLLVGQALSQTPVVTRTSEDLRGGAYATVWGEGFVEGKTIVRTAARTRTWDAAKAKVALETGVDFGVAAQPPASARRVKPLRVRPELMLMRLGLPMRPTPAVLWVEADGQTSRGWVVNRPQVWWLSTDRAAPGARVRGFGRNLLAGLPGRPPLIFIKRDDEPARECEFAGGGIDGNVTDPLSLTYETSFVVPPDTPPGRYQVWFHAGAGEQHGWSRPQKLEIAAPEPEPDLKVEVAKYGAKADGVADDTLAIARAIREVQKAGGGTVVLPAGTLLISNVITVPTKVSLRGAGTDATVVAINPREEFKGLLDIELVPKNRAAQGAATSDC